MSAKVIEKRLYKVEVGSYVRPDNWALPRMLGPSSWDAAEFRLPVNDLGPIKDLAVNVEITGRTIQYKSGNWFLRVRIEFVGDGEPSTFVPGWVVVDPWKAETVEEY